MTFISYSHCMLWWQIVIPLIYGLLIGKGTNNYNLFFEKVLEQDNFQPGLIMTDFEAGTIKPVKEILPNVLHKDTALLRKNNTNINSLWVTRCLFHFGRAVWRQVRSQGLSTKYREDEYCRLNVKKLIAHAFVSVSGVTAAFVLISEQFDDDADNLLDYFEKTWISQQKRRGVFFIIVEKFYMLKYFLGTGRKNSQFEHKLWNSYDRVVCSWGIWIYSKFKKNEFPTNSKIIAV